ncbi:hypothetical protein AB0F17_52345 [Nonomuraea sp. NPDC026600]|uniref:hypothetical protein n=1 Tax=Nonomuraea sp. NPDC026600 TaxID=3155363 RepID=UPI003407CF77
MRLLNAYLPRLHRVATLDTVVGGTFLKVANFLGPPQALLSPGMLWRVWRGRRTGTPTASVASTLGGPQLDVARNASPDRA